MSINKQDNEIVDRFHKQIVELVKKYQFRDRNEICCFGISVSQCYILETLKENGPLTMNTLAQKMYLSVSTVTRVVDHLVKKDYVRRDEDPFDRRIRRITMTEKGLAIYLKSWAKIVESEIGILESLPKDQKENAINLLIMLNNAVDSWRTRN